MENITLKQISDLIDSKFEAREEVTFQKFSDLLDSKLDSRFEAFEKKLDAKLDSRFEAFEKKLDAKLDMRFKAFEKKIITQINDMMDAKLESLMRIIDLRFDSIDSEISKIRKEIIAIESKVEKHQEQITELQGVLISRFHHKSAI
jgi:predicted  nucleic acid-binding Zn-ribbon protein